MKTSQRQQILTYLRKHKTLTPLEALRKFGAFRLASDIHMFRKAGHLIQTIPVTKNGKSFAKYIYKGCSHAAFAK